MNAVAAPPVSSEMSVQTDNRARCRRTALQVTKLTVKHELNTKCHEQHLSILRACYYKSDRNKNTD